MQLTIKGIRVYTDEDFVEAIAILGERKLDPTPLISHRFELKDAKEAFAMMRIKEDCMKILLTP